MSSSRSNSNGQVCATTKVKSVPSSGASQAVDVGRGHRGVTLRQVTDDDMSYLFRLLADPARHHLWMTCRQVFDEHGFHQAWMSWTADAIKTKFLVESHGLLLGLVYEYDRTLEDGHTKVTALLDEESVGRGAGAIGWALLIEWLFQSLPLRKVYMDVYDYNPRVACMLRKVGAVEEGVLQGIRFWNGTYWDLHVFSVSRGGWPDVRTRILGPQPYVLDAADDGEKEVCPMKY